MATPSPGPGPDRLVALAGRWASPHQWSALYMALDQLARDREALHDVATARVRYPFLAPNLDHQAEHLRGLEAQADRLVGGLRDEVQELTELLTERAPELLGEVPPGGPSDYTSLQRAAQCQRLYGLLLARRNTKEQKQPAEQAQDREAAAARVRALKPTMKWAKLVGVMNREHPRPGKPWTEGALRGLIRDR